MRWITNTTATLDDLEILMDTGSEDTGANYYNDASHYDGILTRLDGVWLWDIHYQAQQVRKQKYQEEAQKRAEQYESLMYTKTKINPSLEYRFQRATLLLLSQMESSVLQGDNQ